MRTLELSIALTSRKDKKGTVIQQARKRVPGMAAYPVEILSPGFMGVASGNVPIRGTVAVCAGVCWD